MVARATVTDADAAFGLRSGARAFLTKSESENIVDALELSQVQKRAQQLVSFYDVAPSIAAIKHRPPIATRAA
jgi:hypothetical protein